MLSMFVTIAMLLTQELLLILDGWKGRLSPRGSTWALGPYNMEKYAYLFVLGTAIMYYVYWKNIAKARYCIDMNPSQVVQFKIFIALWNCGWQICQVCGVILLLITVLSSIQNAKLAYKFTTFFHNHHLAGPVFNLTLPRLPFHFLISVKGHHICSHLEKFMMWIDYYDHIIMYEIDRGFFLLFYFPRIVTNWMLILYYNTDTLD